MFSVRGSQNHVLGIPFSSKEEIMGWRSPTHGAGDLAFADGIELEGVPTICKVFKGFGLVFRIVGAIRLYISVQGLGRHRVDRWHDFSGHEWRHGRSAGLLEVVVIGRQRGKA